MASLSPQVVAAISDLELSARLIVEGLRTGSNRSPFHGFSTEFRQHRPYRQGDELKHLDWKVFARTDRLYTRQFRETTNLSLMLVLDTSASMAFPEGTVSKFRYATIAAAALAYLESDQGNAVGLMTMEDGALSYVPARGGRVALRSLLGKLDALSPRGAWDPPRAITRAAQLLRRRGIVIVLSDFYDAEDETLRALRRVVRHGHDVSMLQTISPAELTLPYEGQLEMQDLESGERRLVDAVDLAPRYRAAVTEFLDRWRTNALRSGVDHHVVNTGDAPERVLRDYLRRRGARSSHGASPSRAAR
jgi:uncharacterized protein (DUF58 family)